MDFPAIFSLGVTVLAAILLMSGKLRSDLVGLMVLVVLGLSGLVKPNEVFAGFSGSAVMTILAVSIISEGLHQTGVTRRIGKYMQRIGGKREGGLVLITVLASAFLSLFMNNIAAVGVLLPAVVSISRNTRLVPSRLMMPLAYGVLLGGMATLLTTSNIIVSGALRDAGYAPYGLLDFLPIGLPLVFFGTLYMVFIGRRMLPKQFPSGQAAYAQQLQAALFSLYGIEKNLRNIVVLPGSAMAGQTILDGQWYQRLGTSVVGLLRDGRLQMAPDRLERIREGDILQVQGCPAPQALADFGLKMLDNPSAPARVADETVVLAEVVLAPHTSLIGKSLREMHFREKYGFNVLAIWREGKPLQSSVSDMPLHFGDALLVQGPAYRLPVLRSEPDFIVLEEDPDPVVRPGKARLALALTLITLGIASFEWLPVAVVAMAGAVLMVLANCVSMEDIYRNVEWKAIFLIAGMWPLSTVIRSSGLAQYAIKYLLHAFGPLSPLGVAAILLIVALGLTQWMGGQVASLVLAPLALSAAQMVGTDPRSVGMAVALGCSLGFMTPFGHPVNIVVMSAGGYTFRDYLKVGTPLTLIAIVIILIGLKVFWGL